jgi:hypothetical protein
MTPDALRARFPKQQSLFALSLWNSALLRLAKSFPVKGCIYGLNEVSLVEFG